MDGDFRSLSIFLDFPGKTSALNPSTFFLLAHKQERHADTQICDPSAYGFCPSPCHMQSPGMSRLLDWYTRLQICPLYIFRNRATDDTYGSKYWFLRFGGLIQGQSYNPNAARAFHWDIWSRLIGVRESRFEVYTFNDTGINTYLGGGNSKIFLFSPRSLEKWSNLTNMFQMGWNHQPDIHICGPCHGSRNSHIFFGDGFLLQLRYLLRPFVEQWHSQRTMLHRNRFLQVYTLAWFLSHVESEPFWTGSLRSLMRQVISFQIPVVTLTERASP